MKDFSWHIYQQLPPGERRSSHAQTWEQTWGYESPRMIYLSICLSIYLSIHLSGKAELTPFPPTPFIIMWAPRNHTNIPLICLVVFPILAVSGRCVHTAMVKGGVVAQDCFGYEDLWRLMSWKKHVFSLEKLVFFHCAETPKVLKNSYERLWRVMKGYEGLWRG